MFWSGDLEGGDQDDEHEYVVERQRPLEPAELQLGLPMEMAPDPLRKELEELEPDSLSPLEALQKLYELRSRLHS